MGWLVLVAALGYFVDIYDLLLFSIVRVPSLKDLGLGADAITGSGVLLINCQMAGLLLGGIIWGVWGDQRGRIKVLFGSILLYSLANLANAFVTNIPTYAALRFLAGLGLAGELGAGVTLVVELLPVNRRGLAASIVAAVGILGAVAGGWIAEIFSWRVCYAIGGGMGLTLLFMRLRLQESPLFLKAHQGTKSSVALFKMLLTPRRLLRLALLVLMGLPLWYVVGILITFSPEFAKDLGLEAVPAAGRAVLYCYAGASAGDLLAGFLSYLLGNRKKVIAGYLLTLAAVICYHLLGGIVTLSEFYLSCFFLGLGSGYWALFVTVAAESFGTNLRSTVAVSAPNLVRGAVIPLTMLFRVTSLDYGTKYAGLFLGGLVVGSALLSLFFVEETSKKSMDFQESEA